MNIAKYTSYLIECDFCGESSQVNELEMYNKGFETPEEYFKSLDWDCVNIENKDNTLCPNCAGFIIRLKELKESK